MTFGQVAVIWTCLTAAALALAGLFLRGHVRICRCFAAYLASMVVLSSLTALWPAIFWTWPAYLFRQGFYDVLKIGTALELGYWAFLGFPGAAQTARVIVLLFLVATLAAILALPNQAEASGYLLADVRTRLEVGTAWIFTALAALVRWYRVPLNRLHRTLIVSFTAYLLVFGTAMKLAGDLPVMRGLAAVESLAYTAVCFWWAWEAWRPARSPEADPAVVALLQPWRARP